MYYIGIDLGGTNIKGALVSETGEIAREVSRPTRVELGAEAVCDGIAAVIWLGSYLIVTHQITAGSFVSFIAALIMLYNPIKSIGNNFNSVQMALMAMERVFGVLERTPEIVNCEAPKLLPTPKDCIEYKDVCFSYVKGKTVLDHINLKIKIGETIAFVGNSGGGKTTLVNLLPRFYDVTGGKVMIDGVDIRELDIDSLRDKIAIVFQDNFLFVLVYLLLIRK